MPHAGPRARIAIWCADHAPAVAQRARELAAALRLPVANEESQREFDLLLTVTPLSLELRDPASPHRAGFAVDFRALETRLGRGLSRRQPIARAFGPDVATIVDATAGWCADAVLLTMLGYEVKAVERSPVVSAMLRSARPPARLIIVEGDARNVLPSLDLPPDAVYLDPMYPPKRKASARSRKSIELLRQLVGRDDDAHALFDSAMAVARRRVVVKRADDAPPLAPGAVTAHGGATVRYDVYVPATSSHHVT